MKKTVIEAVESLIVKACEVAEQTVENRENQAPELIRSVAELVEANKKYLS